jgi:hypothetical protein
VQKNSGETPHNSFKASNILRKFPETHYDMNSPNKVFGAHENNFRTF